MDEELKDVPAHEEVFVDPAVPERAEEAKTEEDKKAAEDAKAEEKVPSDEDFARANDGAVEVLVRHFVKHANDAYLVYDLKPYLDIIDRYKERK